MEGIIDFTSTIDLFFVFASTVVIGVVGYVMARVVDWFKNSTPFGAFIPDEAVRIAVYEAIDFAIGAAKLNAKERFGVVQIDNRFVEYAVEYVINAVPDSLEHFGITPDGVAERVKARIGLLLEDEVVVAG